mgnify:CR=1 FL=1
MTSSDFDSEVKYRASLSIIRSMMEKGLIKLTDEVNRK